MSQSHQAWREVAVQLRTVGSVFKSHYRAQETDSRPEPPSQEELKDTLRSLGESATAALGTIGDVLKDPAVGVEVRETAGLFFDALGRSLSELGAGLSNRTVIRESVGRPSSEAAAQSSDPEEEDVGQE